LFHTVAPFVHQDVLMYSAAIQGLGNPRAPVLGLAIAAIAFAAGALATAEAHPRCFGAASRDPVHRCHNPRLRRMVSPRPADALLAPVLGVFCTPFKTQISACRFGVAPEKAVRTVALVGDSHAEHWGGALAVVARRLRWSVVSLIRSSCAFTLGTPIRPEGTDDRACVASNRAIIEWLNQHPEITAVVISDHPAQVRRRPHQTKMDAWVAGITEAWNALPATIARIVVIRDVPFTSVSQLACVERAIARRLDAGARCASRRRRALHHDPDVVAARRLHSRRVPVVDLTHFFCGRRRCYPVVGGVLAFRDDSSHITQAFARTLGPFLAARIKRFLPF
jgi:hypothetical protein